MKATAKTTSSIDAGKGSQFQLFAQAPVSPPEVSAIRPVKTGGSFVSVTRRLRKSGSFLGVISLTVGVVGLINISVAMFFGWLFSPDFLHAIGPVGIALHAAGVVVGLCGCYRDTEGFWGLLGVFCNGMVLASAILLYVGAG